MNMQYYKMNKCGSLPHNISKNMNKHILLFCIYVCYIIIDKIEYVNLRNNFETHFPLPESEFACAFIFTF